MILAADIGNSSVSFGVFDGAELKQTFLYPTADIISKDTRSLLEVFRTYSDISTIAIASVVPEATEATKTLLSDAFPSANVFIIYNSSVPIKNSYLLPEKVGVDRLLGAAAAYQYYGKYASMPAIVIDMGTATTFDCITKDGEYLGGIISLGIGAALKQLSVVGSQLPEVPLQFPATVLEEILKERMQSGILFGALASLEGLVERLTEEAFGGAESLLLLPPGAMQFTSVTVLLSSTSSIHIWYYAEFFYGNRS